MKQKYSIYGTRENTLKDVVKFLFLSRNKILRLKYGQKIYKYFIKDN